MALEGPVKDLWEYFYWTLDAFDALRGCSASARQKGMSTDIHGRGQGLGRRS